MRRKESKMRREGKRSRDENGKGKGEGEGDILRDNILCVQGGVIRWKIMEKKRRELETSSITVNKLI